MKTITFQDLEYTAPIEILDKLWENEELRENPAFHPEPSAYHHIQIVTDRLSALHDIDLILTGFFHDICKKESVVPRTKTVKQPDGTNIEEVVSPWLLCKEHEKLSAEFVLTHKKFIKSLGGNVDKIHWLVLNHMRIKSINEMTKKKKELLTSHKYYNDLVIFSYADKMSFDWEGYLIINKPSMLKKTLLYIKRIIKSLISF